MTRWEKYFLSVQSSYNGSLALTELAIEPKTISSDVATKGPQPPTRSSALEYTCVLRPMESYNVLPSTVLRYWKFSGCL